MKDKILEHKRENMEVKKNAKKYAYPLAIVTGGIIVAVLSATGQTVPPPAYGSVGGVLSGTLPNPGFAAPFYVSGSYIGLGVAATVNAPIIMHVSGGNNVAVRSDNAYAALAFVNDTSTAYAAGDIDAIALNLNPNSGGTINIGSSSSTTKIPSLKSTTGVRYLCIDSSGQVVSQSVACVGT